MLLIYHCPAHVFCSFHFSLSALHQLQTLSYLQQFLVPLWFPLSDVVITKGAMPSHWAFPFQGSGYPYHSVESGQALCMVLALLYKTLR